MPSRPVPVFLRLLLTAFLLMPAVGGSQMQVPASALGALSAEDRARALQALQGQQGESSDAPATRQTPLPLPVNSVPVQRGKLPGTEDGLSLFGYQLFNSAGIAGLRQGDAPVPQSYLIGPGDIVRVQLFGNQNETLNLTVTRDGAINFPKLGPIQVAGLSVDSARAVIDRRVGKELIGVQTNITMGPLRGIQVFLLGDARQPGAYTVSGLATLTTALMAGGGVADTGSLRKIQLKRDGRLVQKLDLYDFLLRGDSSADVRIESGDAVFIPPVGARIAIAGAVTRPAVYEINEGITVRQALELAGGLTGNARRAQASLSRIGASDERQLRELDLRDAGTLSSVLRNGDRLDVSAIYERADNPVSVLGHVRYEKSFAWSPGLTLRRVLSLAEVRPSEPGRELYSAMALVERSGADTGLRTWHGFDLAAVQSGKLDEPVEPMDRVVVLTRADVAYLLASEVRNALQGQLPRPVSEFAVSEATAIAADEESSGDAERSAKAQTGICPALLDVVKMSDSVRAVNIRVLLEGQASSAENRFGQAMDANRQQAAVQAAEGKVCPRVFQAAPTALPYLLERSAGLTGEVRQPGLYPFVPGTSIGRLTTMAGGETAEASEVEIEFFNVSEVLEGGASRFRRLPRDADFAAQAAKTAIYKFLPATSLPEVGAVTIRGEVRFPGRYVVTRGERYSELIVRAGGLTESAYPYGTVFTRASAREQEIAANRRAAADLRESLVNAATQGISPQAASSTGNAAVLDLVQRLETAPTTGRVVIEADPLAIRNYPDADFLLEPGDGILVPKRPNSIAVIGRVLSPGSLAFVEGGSAEDYIRQSGGLAQGSDGKRTFMVLPNGAAKPLRRSFWRYENVEVAPGSVIVVPRDVAPFTALALTERITSILSNLALSAAALVTINR